MKEPKGRGRFISINEADKLHEELPDHLKPIVKFDLATGLRMDELLRLEWSQIDFDRQVAWLNPGTTKNGDGRGIPLNKDALLALKRVQGQHPTRCFTFAGKPMKEIGEAFKRTLKRTGITNFTFHDLRHTWASWHVMNGTSLQELMELGGWKSYEMVLRYAHLAPEHLKKAASRIERKM